MDNILYHHGIDGQKWGDRNGPPYPLKRSQLSSAERAQKKDLKWVKRNDKKIQRYAMNASKNELKQVKRELDSKYRHMYKSGTKSKSYMTEYSKNMARIMNTKIKDLETPNGYVVQFVAKRGNIGVYTAMATKDYDISQLKNGLYESGKVAYKNKTINKV